MGYFSDLAIQVEVMLFDGASHAEIAKTLNISIEEVEAQVALLEEVEVEDYEPDFEDDGDALASAGFGTDEDYGYYGEEY